MHYAVKVGKKYLGPKATYGGKVTEIDKARIFNNKSAASNAMRTWRLKGEVVPVTVAEHDLGEDTTEP